MILNWNKSLFLVSLGDEFNEDSVVVPPKSKSDLESRLEVVEKKLSELLKSQKKISGAAEILTKYLLSVNVSYNIENALVNLYV